ncbi:hypothetical protein HRbin11_02125 [bacterium HR11]|nr:hypothetical protein HRbin11_02125 [bacterium HR11]
MLKHSPLYRLLLIATGVLLTFWNLAWLMPAFWSDRPGLWGALAHGSYVCLRLVCHQRPDRTFHIDGRPLGVCQRCSGLYTGLWVGWLAGWAAPWARRRMKALGYGTLVAWSLMVFEWFLGLATAWNHAETRFLTGLIAGGSLAYALLSGFYHALETDAGTGVGAASPARASPGPDARDR